MSLAPSNAAIGELYRGAVSLVDPGHRIGVAVPSGEAIRYDMLVVAVGALPRPAVPGALTFAGPQDAPAVEGLLNAVAGGVVKRLAFTLPTRAPWSLPVTSWP